MGKYIAFRDGYTLNSNPGLVPNFFAGKIYAQNKHKRSKTKLKWIKAKPLKTLNMNQS